MNAFTYPIEDYIHFIRVERQLSANTLASYRRDLEGYAQHLQDVQQLKDYNEVTQGAYFIAFRKFTNRRKDRHVL